MNPEAFLAAPWVIQLHAVAAVAALVIGLVQWFGPKGHLVHRLLGVTFVGLMLVTALSAVFIRQLNDGQFSPVHLFVPLTLVGLVGLVWSVRGARTGEHGRRAGALFFGALILPGLFAFLPGRLMFTIVFGSIDGS